jgi:hypothetical protein
MDAGSVCQIIKTRCTDTQRQIDVLIVNEKRVLVLY